MKKAAEKGYVDAQYQLGVLYESIKDLKAAVTWYEIAANQNHADAQCNLGVMYYNGEGVDEDQKKFLEE